MRLEVNQLVSDCFSTPCPKLCWKLLTHLEGNSQSVQQGFSLDSWNIPSSPTKMEAVPKRCHAIYPGHTKLCGRSIFWDIIYNLWCLLHILLSWTVGLAVGPLGQNTSLIISGVHIFLSNQLLSMCLEKAAECWGRIFSIAWEKYGKIWKSHWEGWTAFRSQLARDSDQILGNLSASGDKNFAIWDPATNSHPPAEESSSWTSSLACQRVLRRMAGGQCCGRLRVTT